MLSPDHLGASLLYLTDEVVGVSSESFCILSRKISFSKAEKLSTGEIFSGNQALENGLIDMLGTMEDAVLIASQKAGGKGRPIIIYPPEEKKGLLNALFGNILHRASLSNLNLYPQVQYSIK